MSADNLDPFAFARQPEGDAELFALIEEHRTVSARARAWPADDLTGMEERLWDRVLEIEQQVEIIQPATLRGVVAALELWRDEALRMGYSVPSGAIAGLRTLVEGEAPQ